MQRSDRAGGAGDPEAGSRGDSILPGQIADHIHLRAAGQEELQDHPAQLPHPFIAGFDDVSGGGDIDAGGHHPGPFAFFDLHDAEPAGPVGRDGRVMAQRGDVDAEAPGHAQRRLVGIGLRLLPVDRENNVLRSLP